MELTKAVVQWLQVREENGIAFNRGWHSPVDWRQFCADMDHSALLSRLLEGKEPLPEAPPRAMSYPNYKLIEDGNYEPMEVFEYLAGGESILVIDQMEWVILQKIEADHWIATYKVVDKDALLALVRESKLGLSEYLAEKPTLPRDGAAMQGVPMRHANGQWRVQRTGFRAGYAAKDALAKTWMVELQRQSS